MKPTLKLLGLAIALAAGMACGPAHAYVGPDDASGYGADLPAASQKRVADGVQLMRRDRKPAPDRAASSLAAECLAAADVYARGDHSVEKTLRGAADDLLASTLDDGKKPAWGRRVADNKASNCPGGGNRDFGVCDAADTAYIVQSGEANTCIARAAKLTGDQKYADFLKKSQDFWMKHSTVYKECGNCREFSDSDSDAHGNRYARNLNLFGALSFAVSDGRPGYTPPVVQDVLRAETWEASRHNKGYLSALDPAWSGKNQASESDRIEDHTAALAALLKSVYIETGDPQAMKLALDNYTTWANCTNDRCKKADCHYWGGDSKQCLETYTYVHCAFRNDSPIAKDRCQEALDRTTSTLDGDRLMFVLLGDKRGGK